jgi:hypothetical protein
MSYIKLSILFLLCFVLTGLQAHDALPAIGGDGSGSGGSINYSVGQIVYTTNTGFSGSVAQGVQHSFEIFEVTSIEEVTGINLKVYPNPTTNYLTLNQKKVKCPIWGTRLSDMGTIFNSTFHATKQ